MGIATKLQMAALMVGASLLVGNMARAQAFDAEAIEAATFERWKQREAGKAVLEVDQRSGEVEAAEGSQSSSEEGDSATVSVPGQSDTVVETPEASTDVPDEAAAQVQADPSIKEEAEEASSESAEGPDPFLVRVQVLLDRAYTSPGVIDGLMGENTRKAIEAYQRIKDMDVTGEITAELWSSLSQDEASPVQTYKLTEDDINGRYVDEVPDDYAKLAELDWIGYHDVTEMLAERFHMDQDLLKLLNPNTDFTAAGTEIAVVAPGGVPEKQVTRIEIDKEKGELRAFGDGDKPVFVAPATIGSEDTPSPSGTMKVLAAVEDPTYTYNPEENFQQGDNKEKLEIAPGPNGPVGNVWIDLSKPTYGIHGTPEPAMIDKSASHGCVRLTNWDAGRLADLVKPEETSVEFLEE
ncbi:L,D-transpeptidase [Tianweitania sediminis]|uniref:L,D-transpeptidase family protein n=1 Tax=Tianweitania sediminis TaxID=1502156 RepID=UPI003158ED30